MWEEMEQALSEAAQFRKQHAAKCADGNCGDCSSADEAVLPQGDDLALLIASHMPASFLNTEIPSAVSEAVTKWPFQPALAMPAAHPSSQF